MIAPKVAGFADDRRGVAAVEFAITLPMLIVLFFGGFCATKTLAISRKVTITTRALADLTSQYSQMSASDMSTVMNASSQIIAPFDATPLGMRISEITLDVTGLIATVTWSVGNSSSQATPYKAGSAFTLPTGMTGPSLSNASFVYAETFYTYVPPLGGTILPSVNLGDRIFMLPRVSTAIAYTGS